MDNIRCIYCGKGESDGIELSISDIIPEGLTNKLVKNRNVCRIEHNAKFSNSFESYVINKLEYLRNYLGILNKDGKLPPFTTEYIIEDITFRKKLVTQKELYSGKIISGKNESTKFLFGDKKNLEMISNYDEEKCKEFSSLNEIDITQRITLDLGLFFSDEMKRLAAKVGYEWFCKVFEINDRFPEYDNVVNFILNKNNDEELVSVIVQQDLYGMLNEQLELGSHALTIYDDPDRFTYVIFMFFGLVMYKIRIKNADVNAIEWQSIPFYGIRYDGSVVHPLWIKMNVRYQFHSINAEDGIEILKHSIIENYSKLLSTQIFTLRNFYSTVQETATILSSQTGDDLYNNLLGYKTDRMLYSIFVLSRLGRKNGSYDYNKSFNTNFKEILNVDDRVVFIKEELFNLLQGEYKDGSLLVDLEHGIDVFMKSYQKEI
jgi:hypothetical protein